VLSLMLRSERPAARHWGRWILWSFIGVFVLTLALSLVSPDLATMLGTLWGWGVLTLFAIGLGRLIWFVAIDPIFNTLLLLDPLGRQAVQYDPADGAVTGGVVALLIGLVGVALTFPLLGNSHPLSEAAFILCFGAGIATILAATIRTTDGSSRLLSWIGYAMIVPALLGIVIIRLIYAVDAESPIAGMMVALAGLLFTIGFLLFLVGRIIVNAQRRSRERATRPQRQQGA
jgi:hypothetical protein